MQLTFPNGESANVALDQGEIAVGSRIGNQVCLPDAGLSAHHASFLSDRRGLWLRVPSNSPVHVNARPVRKLAWLRAGDLVCLDKLRILVRADDEPAIDRRVPATAPVAMNEAQQVSASRVVLRCLSGPHYGRAFPLTEPRVIGRSASADIRIEDPSLAERHASMELHGDRVMLRALDAQAGSVVNGVPVRDAQLAPGDQVVIEQFRFVLEAPGLPPRGAGQSSRPASVSHTQTIKAVPPPENSAAPATRGAAGPDRPMRDPGALWWLIAAAAVLAAALTALLVYAPRMG